MNTSEYINTFNSYRMYIFYFCRKFINNHNDAEDITSFVFLRLWENKERVDLVSAKSYLMITASHKCQDYFKNKKRYPEVLERASLYDINDLEIEISVIDHLYSIINKFHPQEKKMLLLKYKDGKEVKEISKLLNLSPQTVSNTLNNGIKRIRSIIKNKGFHIG